MASPWAVASLVHHALGGPESRISTNPNVSCSRKNRQFEKVAFWGPLGGPVQMARPIVMHMPVALLERNRESSRAIMNALQCLSV